MLGVSVIDNNDVNITRLAPALGLTLTTAPSLVPYRGNVSYDLSTDLLYLGNPAGDTWLPIKSGTSGDLTLGAFGSTPTAKGAVITASTPTSPGQVLTLEPADATHAGCVSTLDQTFGGVKSFTGIAVGLGNTSVLSNYYRQTVSLGIYHGVTLLQTSVFVFERIGNLVNVIMPQLAMLKASFPGDAQTAVQGVPADFVPTTTGLVAYGNMTTIYSARPSAGANSGWMGYARIIYSGGQWQIFVNPDYDNNTTSYLNFGDAGTGTHDGWMPQTVSFLLV